VDADLEHRIRDAYAAFAGGEVERLRQFFREDALYVNPPYAMEAGTRQGHAALVEIWETLHHLFAYDSVDVQEITAGPDGVIVVVRYRGRGKASNAPVDVPMTHVLQFDEDGLVARLAWFSTRDEAAAAAGL
jgi:ketosteroid isomerase-like protein